MYYIFPVEETIDDIHFSHAAWLVTKFVKHV